MRTILFALLQIAAASGLFYGYYHFFLRNKIFHQYNRFYLLAATLISLLIPFLNIPVYFSNQQTDNSVLYQTLKVISVNNFDSTAVIATNKAFTPFFTWEKAVGTFYIFIALIVFTRFCIALYKIKLLLRNNNQEKLIATENDNNTVFSKELNQITFINTSEEGTPFSFFRWLFWNKKIELDTDKGRQIFRHELFHIKQKHSWDIVFMELLTVILWINPFFHLIKKEIKAIHEFLADKYAADENEKWNYAELLLMQALGTQTNRLTNYFFHNQIKRRIAMITSIKKPGYNYISRVMVLPLLLLICAAFIINVKKAGTTNSNLLKVDNTENTLFVAPLILKDSPPALISGHIEIENGDLSNLGNEFPVGTKKPILVVNGKILTTEQLKSKVIKSESGKVYPANSPEAVKLYGNIAVNGVIVLNKATIKENKNNTVSIQADSIFFNPPVIKKDGDAGDASMEDVAAVFNPPYIKKDDFLYRSLIVVNGKVLGYGKDIKDDLEKIMSKGLIGTLTVLKDKLATDKYGEIGKHGVVEIVENTNLKLDDVKVERNEEPVFSEVEIPAQFPGGQDEWRKYLTKNLKADIAVKEGWKPGTYNVTIQFIIDKEGNLSKFEAMNYIGSKTAQHCIDIIKNGPKWIPAEQNGKKVNTYYKQPVTFVIDGSHNSKLLNNDKNTLPGEVVAVGYKSTGIEQIPVPYLINPREGTNIKLEDLQKCTELKLQTNNKNLKIVSYQFHIDLDNGDLAVASMSGSFFSSRTSELIASTKPGHMITFESILAKDGDKLVKIPAKLFNIK
jgi:beta-lactamase regulating signal transducer with metallopeptidase domain